MLSNSKYPVFTLKGIYPGIYLWGYLPFYQQGYYLFWFEFSQNFVNFELSQICEYEERKKPSSKYTPGIYLGTYPGKNPGKYLVNTR